MGSKFPIQNYGQLVETKAIKIRWADVKIHEHKSKIAGLQNAIDQEQQLLEQALAEKSRLENSIDV